MIPDLLASARAASDRPFPTPPRRAGLAQLVEQRFCKPLVAGSNPATGTIYINGLDDNFWPSGTATKRRGS